MSSDPKSAFPHPNPIYSYGMTLRDYFAAKVLQGLCAVDADHRPLASAAAEVAYSFADAMLKEREKGAGS
jgi:hypothetical protein